MTAQGLRVEVLGLHKHYRVAGQPLPVLHDLNLQAAPSEFLCIVGPSGCGKSTLLRLLAGLEGLEGDHQGQLLADGHAITGPALERGIVFQDPRLFPWQTVSENIGNALFNSALSKTQRQAAITQQLERMGLQAFAQAHPQQLSGGMAQRVALARALVNQPRLLLLDEPLNALDALTRSQLQDELLRLWQAQRPTVLLVTHDVEEALLLGSRVLVMSPRPGHITHSIEVDLPYPRQRSDAALVAVRQTILALLGAPA